MYVCVWYYGGVSVRFIGRTEENMLKFSFFPSLTATKCSVPLYGGQSLDDLPRNATVEHVQVPLEKNSGKLEDGEDTVAVTIPLGSEFTMVEGTNANGIEFINANGIEVHP